METLDIYPVRDELCIEEEKMMCRQVLQHTRTKDNDNSMHVLEQNVGQSYNRLTQPFQPL